VRREERQDTSRLELTASLRPSCKAHGRTRKPRLHTPDDLTEPENANSKEDWRSHLPAQIATILVRSPRTTSCTEMAGPSTSKDDGGEQIRACVSCTRFKARLMLVNSSCSPQPSICEGFA
jgi:hypothetical protein